MLTHFIFWNICYYYFGHQVCCHMQDLSRGTGLPLVAAHSLVPKVWGSKFTDRDEHHVPLLEGGSLTTGPPGKSQPLFLKGQVQEYPIFGLCVTLLIPGKKPSYKFYPNCKNSEQFIIMFLYFLDYCYELIKVYKDIFQMHLNWANLKFHSRYTDSASPSGWHMQQERRLV